MRKLKSSTVVSPTSHIFSISAWEALARPLLLVAGLACAGLGAAIFHLLQRTKLAHWRRFLVLSFCIAILYSALHFWAALAADASVAIVFLRIAKLIILTTLLLTMWFAVPRLLELSDRERLRSVSRELQSYVDEKSRRAEEKLRTSEERYRSLVAATSSIVWTSDENGAFQDRQPSWESYTGQSWAESRGLGWCEKLHPEDRKNFRLQWEQALRDGKPFRAVGRLWHAPTQAYRQIEGRAVPLRGRHGKTREWIGTFNDTQDRCVAQEEERKFKFLSDNANDAHFLVNRESRIVYANRIACEMLGHSLEDLTQMSIAQIDQLFDRDRFESFFDPSENSRVALFEASFLRKDRTVFPVEVGLSRLEYGGDTYLFSVARDITERRISEESLKMHAEELSRSNRELEQFAYISSHDLKEPLRMVTVYVQLLQKHLEQEGRIDEKVQEYLGFAVHGSRRMLSLINDLLAYSRVGKDLGPFTEVDTNAVFQSAVDNLGPAIAEAGALVEATPLPEILGHAGQLGQLFENLIANALKFRDPDRIPRVEITAEPSGDSWTFHVRDNGIGIHSRYLKRIFVIFQRLHTVQKYPGTGIGLSICKKIVENHGGTIWVDSRLGEGSIFSFSIPKARKFKAPLTQRPTLVIGKKGALDVSLA